MIDRKHPENDIRAALDAQLSGLERAPGLYQRVLRASKEEPYMKKKLSVSLALVLTLCLLIGIALAANWQGVRYFLTERLSVPENVAEEQLIQPALTACDSRWLTVAPIDASWVASPPERGGDSLYLTLHVALVDQEKAFCCETEIGCDGESFDMIWIGGEVLPVETWRDGREILQLLLNAPAALNGEDVLFGYDFIREGDGATYLLEFRSPSPDALSRESALTLRLTTQNLQTGEREDASVTLALPPMTMTPAA